ncbi:hypothetical protein M947_00555 [Sulfurimonas hongkongensis]|uniref:Motility protein n=1 Tax=Sulfurimonas hongkongensis TaxID=1172190 RepID=T0KTJ4_9BACT|nr:hypothetical protein [Sulfurimonas hongkongensis]EQB40319.1 hypothetical protein M947_00555 [Sulfurimonas hongkongensis]
MEVSSNMSPTTTAPTESGKDPMKKALEVQEQQVLKVLDSANELSKEMNAQKTGMGKNLNITG